MTCDECKVKEIEAAILERCPEKRLPCKVAFEVAEQLAVKPIDIGQAADRLKVKIIGCQLGCFGAKKEK